MHTVHSLVASYGPETGTFCIIENRKGEYSSLRTHVSYGKHVTVSVINVMENPQTG